MTLEELQEAAKFISYTRPVVWLVNSSKAIYKGHLLHPAALQGLLPGSSRLLAVRVAQTKTSLKFFRQRNLLTGEAGMPPIAILKREG